MLTMGCTIDQHGVCKQYLCRPTCSPWDAPLTNTVFASSICVGPHAPLTNTVFALQYLWMPTCSPWGVRRPHCAATATPLWHDGARTRTPSHVTLFCTCLKCTWSAILVTPLCSLAMPLHCQRHAGHAAFFSWALYCCTTLVLLWQAFLTWQMVKQVLVLVTLGPFISLKQMLVNPTTSCSR